MQARESKKMTTSEVIHSFLEEQPVDRTKNDHICIRFLRKKFKCILIFFLALCLFAETSMLALEKINFNVILEKFLSIANQSNSTFTWWFLG